MTFIDGILLIFIVLIIRQGRLHKYPVAGDLIYLTILSLYFFGYVRNSKGSTAVSVMNHIQIELALRRSILGRKGFCHFLSFTVCIDLLDSDNALIKLRLTYQSGPANSIQRFIKFNAALNAELSYFLINRLGLGIRKDNLVSSGAGAVLHAKETGVLLPCLDVLRYSIGKVNPAAYISFLRDLPQGYGHLLSVYSAFIIGILCAGTEVCKAGGQ